MEEFELIAKTFQGLEEVLAKELTALGANNIEIGRRMVSFSGDKEMMYRANFALRTAIRILKPIKHFTANSADEVYEAIKAIEWEQYMDNKMSFAIDAVVFSDEFRHSKFVAYKVKDAIVDYFREKTGERPSVRINKPDLALNIHIAQNKCTLSLDSSGESLHRRGYRQEAVEAPLNEVLAAGMILLTGWQGECSLIDPMGGSGTIPIEAALIARNIAPGVFRKEFAFEKWNDFDQELFDKIYNDDSQEREFTHKIYGYDNSPQANEIAMHNIKAAGVTKDVVLKLQPFQQFETPEEKSILITNPPYGERISTNDLLGLYQMIGERLKHAFTDNDAWILSYRTECFDQIALKPSAKIPLFNGALECEFRKYQIFSGKYKEYRQNNEEESGSNGEQGENGGERKERREYASNRNNEGEGERRFDKGEEDTEGGERKYVRKERSFDRKERSFGDGERKYERRERSFDNDRKRDGQKRSFDRGEHSTDRRERRTDAGSDRRGRSFGDRERKYERRERSAGDGERKYERRERSAGDGERKYERRERSTGDGERKYERRERSTGDGERKYERRERSFDRGERGTDRRERRTDAGSDRRGRSFGDRERKYEKRERPTDSSRPAGRRTRISSKEVRDTDSTKSYDKNQSYEKED